jgi:hypothetical protein
MDLSDFVESTRFINFAKALDSVAPLTTALLIVLLITREVVEVTLSSQTRLRLRILNIGLVPITLIFVAIFIVKVLLTFV